MAGAQWKIDIVTENDLVDLLPLLQSYCQFYNETEQIPLVGDETLLSISRALIANPKDEGIQLIVRDPQNQKAVAFATIFWTWATLQGGRIAIMNDLFISSEYRGKGLADILIKECAKYARDKQAVCLSWQTSVDNKRAQTVYNRSGAVKNSRWLDYYLDLTK